MRFPILAALVAMQITLSAHADAVDLVNSIRARGCEGRAGLKSPLQRSRDLDRVAQRWSRGGRLRDALKDSDGDGYRAVNSASMHIEGTTDQATISGVLASGYCTTILNAEFRDIGMHRRGDHVWIVLANPLRLPQPGEAPAIAGRVLELVNQARAKARRCGDESFRPAPPLRLSPMLSRVALGHAQDMARHSLFEHRGSDGSLPAARATRAGYRWRAVAENIAVGSTDAQTVVAGWLDSPGHCANIMGSQFAEMGIAFAVDAKSRDGIYWAQVFASPR